MHTVVARLGFRRSRSDYEDAVSVGTLALVEAAGRFDASKGAFSTYAWHRVLGAIKDLMTSDNARPVPSEALLGEALKAQAKELHEAGVACSEEFDPDSEAELHLHYVLSDASPALARAADVALAALLTAEWDPRGVDARRGKLQRCAAALERVRRVAEAERSL